MCAWFQQTRNVGCTTHTSINDLVLTLLRSRETSIFVVFSSRRSIVSLVFENERLIPAHIACILSPLDIFQCALLMATFLLIICFLVKLTLTTEFCHFYLINLYLKKCEAFLSSWLVLSVTQSQSGNYSSLTLPRPLLLPSSSPSPDGLRTHLESSC